MIRADEDNDYVIESYSLYYIFSVFPSFVYCYVILGDNIIEILNRVYLKYPHIKIEEPLYDFDVDYL